MNLNFLLDVKHPLHECWVAKHLCYINVGRSFCGPQIYRGLLLRTSIELQTWLNKKNSEGQMSQLHIILWRIFSFGSFVSRTSQYLDTRGCGFPWYDCQSIRNIHRILMNSRQQQRQGKDTGLIAQFEPSGTEYIKSESPSKMLLRHLDSDGGDSLGIGQEMGTWQHIS